MYITPRNLVQFSFSFSHEGREVVGNVAAAISPYGLGGLKGIVLIPSEVENAIYYGKWKLVLSCEGMESSSYLIKGKEVIILKRGCYESPDGFIINYIYVPYFWRVGVELTVDTVKKVIYKQPRITELPV
jgi:hypothetical protein